MFQTIAPSFRNAKHRDQWISTLEAYVFPQLGARSVDTLSVADFARALQPIWLLKEETASRVRQRCERVMTWCIANGHCATNPLSAVDALLPRQSGARDRVTHHPAAPWRTLPEIVSNMNDAALLSVSRQALLFLILTAARSGEVRGALWGEIDLDDAIWTIPRERMKAGRQTVQSAPKPSFGPYYLAQGQHDWSDATSTLAGVKTYPARGVDESALKSTLQSWIPTKGNAARNTKIRSKLVFLLPRNRGEKITFTAEIRFHNVCPVELGALIWAMTFGGNPQLRHMIGRAKAAGAGQARITPVAVELRHGAPDTPEVAAFCAARMQDFETFMGADWRESETVQALLAWADPAQGRALGRAGQLNYLPLPLHRKLRDHARTSRKPRLLDRD